MKLRLILTLILVGIYWFFRMVYEPFRTSLQAQLAVGQLKDDWMVSNLSRQAAQADLVGTVVAFIVLVLLAVIWLPVVIRWGKDSMRQLTAFVVVMVLMSSACYSVERLEEIAPNETAFLVPLEGATQEGQARFMSEEFLEQSKVASKRVTISHRSRSTGWFPWNIEWLDTVRLIKVDRKPVVREWTKATETGTSHANQAFKVESAESIDFWVGGVASASIREENAAKFLYYFNGRTLEEVMDNNVRGLVQKVTFGEFGIRTLDAGRLDKQAIFTLAQQQAKEAFEMQGITIEYIGGSEGLTYVDPKIQQAINQNFESQQGQVQAAAVATAQAVRNGQLVSQSGAEATATVISGQAAADVLAARGAQIAAYPGLAELAVAERYKGDVPQALSVGSGSGGMMPIIVPMPAPAPLAAATQVPSAQAPQQPRPQAPAGSTPTRTAGQR